MTIKELIKELQQYPSNMEVVRIVDFENPDEDGKVKVEPIEQIMHKLITMISLAMRMT